MQDFKVRITHYFIPEELFSKSNPALFKTQTWNPG